MKKIYILLPVHNRCAVTQKFIECLAAQTYANYHLVLINDGSIDGTTQMVQARINALTVLEGQGNWWWAGSLQQGINWLNKNKIEDSDVVMFANDDIVFDVDFLQKAVSILDDLNRTLLLPHLYDEKTGLREETGVHADLKELSFVKATSLEKINCLPTRGIFMRMCDLQIIGGFRPHLLPHYLSDYEFTIRAHKKGLKLVTNGEITIQLDKQQTGFHSLEGLKFFDYLKRLFSKKNVSNPIYWSVFILMTVPKHHILPHILQIWGSTVKNLFIKLFAACKTNCKGGTCS